MPKQVVVIGALDTKGEDFAFIKERIEERGFKAIVVDVGVMGEPPFKPDVDADAVAKAGGESLSSLRAKGDKGNAMVVMTRGAAEIAKKLYAEGRLDAIFGMGGSAGTAIISAAMRALPLGVPKVLVSTVASGDTKPYVGTKDIVMIPSIVDVAGVNVISAEIYSRAVGAIVGMLETEIPKVESKPLIAASMFGNTTQLINQCRDIMERADFEVMVFHATGTGGMTMEDLIENGYFVGALDLTTTELADELCGGVMSAGPKRLTAAGLKGIPQVVAPGCLDMVNFWAVDTVPEKYKSRKLYPWNPNVTLMRTTPEENAKLGQIMAQRLNQSKGPTAVFFPLKGLSQLDSPGGEFWWPEADMALLETLKQNLRKDIPLIEVDANINDPEFAKAATDKMLEFLAK
ncbi:MAG TPA: Tm-1-like ATP-binding domain-containing protein [Acetomicrobium flavidum]|uniref:Tm-1-like ATP-binding domain-containing protein n=1 Tax=Acetomicrobium flavidum TaxID=49896 RepID=UPI002BC95B6C|nr:Tm-1-like ATP-binding domain-containing protein [Acetomicrobium flavidum]